MPPPLIPYDKGPLTYDQQLQRLKNRGLIVSNEVRALHLLEKISYYRLSGYWYPFIADRATNRFEAGTTFETAFNLYCFDRELRLLVLNEIEKIEVAVRAHLIYEYAHTHGAFWFTDTSLFITSTPSKHVELMNDIRRQHGRSDDEFIRAFHSKYNDPLPPSWMIMEVVSFGTLSKTYKYLKRGVPRRAVASKFGVTDSVFESWLHSMVYLRNVCAHHSRMWNRVFQVTPAIPRKTIDTWLNTVPANSRSYFMLSMLVYMLQKVNPKSTFKTKFKTLLNKYPEADTRFMGFLPTWEEEPLWQS